MSETALCANCQGALVSAGRSMVHVDGYYRCPSGGFADPVEADEILSPEDLSRKIDEAFEDGREDALDDVRNEIRDERDRILTLIEGCVAVPEASRDIIIDHIRRESR